MVPLLKAMIARIGLSSSMPVIIMLKICTPLPTIHIINMFIGMLLAAPTTTSHDFYNTQQQRQSSQSINLSIFKRVWKECRYLELQLCDCLFICCSFLDRASTSLRILQDSQETRLQSNCSNQLKGLFQVLKSGAIEGPFQRGLWISRWSLLLFPQRKIIFSTAKIHDIEVLWSLFFFLSSLFLSSPWRKIEDFRSISNPLKRINWSISG